MNIKMILTDLDGTLIRSDGSISERTKAILKSCQNRGICVAIAAARYPKTEITVAVGRQVFWNSDHISESEKLHKTVYYDYRETLSHRANKIVAELPDPETAEQIADKNHCRLQSYRGEKWYAFLPETAGKVQAVKELAKILNISFSDIAAFGDDKNDMEMFPICGTGVAVANAVSDVKVIADCVTLSNDEDGVAEWLAKNVLME